MRAWTEKQIRTAENDTQCLLNHELGLCIEFEDFGDCTNATVSNIKTGACSSMACAEYEGTLEYEGVDCHLTKEQIEWITSNDVTEWLESVGY